MNRKQQSVNDMYDVIISFLDATPPAIMLMLIHFPGYYSSFKAAVAILFANAQAQALDRSGYAQSKVNLRILLNKTLLELAAKLMAYATFIEDPVLYNQIDLKKYVIEKTTDTEIIAIAKTIIDIATEHVLDLAVYGVTAITLAADALLLDNYRIAKPKPQLAIKDKKIATKEIKTAISAAKKFLEKMDGVVLTIQTTEPTFVKNYFAKRKANDPQSCTMAARGLITDPEGIPLPFVRMTCKELNINRKASANGKFLIRHATEGPKNLIFTCPGYEPVTLKVIFRAGQRADLVITMKLIE